MRAWLLSLGVSLALTLVIELGFALIFRRRGRALLYVALANLLTNPAAVLCVRLCAVYTALPSAAVTAGAEILAVLTEGLVYKTSQEGFSRPWLFSLGANALSYGLGLGFSHIF